MMLLYSLALAAGLVLASPWWIFRMLTTERYREGLRQRLGGVPAGLRATVRGKRVVWLHAVSVGEVLAASRLVTDLGEALGADWIVAISTTTRTGQQLAKERFGAERVFYMPLDFAWTVRRYLNTLQPEVVVLMESELWPRLLDECQRRGVPTLVANARMSDRSFARGMKVRWVWKHVLRKVTVFLAQSEQDAERLREVGAQRVELAGNLKFDISPTATPMVEVLRRLVTRRKLFVAGSLVEGEEAMLLRPWLNIFAAVPEAVLLLAPRHPERFSEAYALAKATPGVHAYRASELRGASLRKLQPLSVVILDTIGDLAGVYETATAAFVGGSLVAHGGHNPLEPARFGVPILMGPSYENFREIVERMLASNSIAIVGKNAGVSPLRPMASGRDDTSSLTAESVDAFIKMLSSDDGMGERGRQFFLSQQGATERVVAAVLAEVGR